MYRRVEIIKPNAQCRGMKQLFQNLDGNVSTCRLKIQMNELKIENNAACGSLSGFTQ